jgi:DHA2 family multidrug resistance protein
MEVLDTTIVSVSLPNIAGSLSVSNNEATWAQTSYLVANAVVLPASAWFSSFFGRKRFLITCIILFTLASLLCGIAPNIETLILARILQGAGGGALQPLSQAILLECFPPKQHGQAMAFYGLGVIIAPILGPVLGGWITDNYSWRWLFFINIPMGILAIWLISRFVHDPDYIKNAKPGRIDAIGFGLLTLWLGTLQIVLDKGQEADWFASPWICTFAIVSIFSFLGFIFWELHEEHPLTDLRVFKNQNFLTGTILISIACAFMYSQLTVLPLFLQGLIGYSSIQSGLVQLSRGCGALIAMPLMGMLVGKIDSRILIGGGLFLMGLASWILSGFTLVFSQNNLFLPNLFIGFGMGMTMVPLMTISLGMLRKEQMGNASGLFALARNLAGSIGIALITAMITRFAQIRQATIVHNINPQNPVYQQMKQAAEGALSTHVGSANSGQAADMLIYSQLQQQSTMMAYLDGFRLLCIICLMVLPAVFMLKRTQTAAPSAAMH